jgi:hypothetical protein
MGRVLCPVLAPPRVWLLVWRHSRWREGEQAATSRAGGGAALGGRKGVATTAHLGMESYASCRRPPPRHLASCSLCFTSSPARESQGSPPAYALDRRRHGRGSRKQGRSVAGEVRRSPGQCARGGGATKACIASKKVSAVPRTSSSDCGAPTQAVASACALRAACGSSAAGGARSGARRGSPA